jgi:dipeptidyl aminopeptidase/acylaminoacyl peptidase
MRKILMILFTGIFYCFNLLPAAGESKATALIPVQELMQDPLIDQVKISPDGKSIAALYNNNNRIMVLVKDLTDDNSQPSIINVLNHDVKTIVWANNDRLIAGTLVEGGIWNDYYALVVMDKNGSNMRHLLSDFKIGDIIDILPDDPEHVLVEEFSLTDYSSYPEVYRVSIGNKRDETRIQESKFNIHHWMTDANGNVKIGFTWLSDKRIIEAKMADGTWKAINERNYVKDPLFEPLVISKSGMAYVLSRHENDKAALYEYDLNTQTFGKQLFKHDLVDLDGVYYSRLKDALEYATFTLDSQALHFFDDQLSKDYLAASQALPDMTNLIVSQSDNEKRLIIYSGRDNNPGSYYLFDRENKKLKYLGSRYANLEKIALSRTKAVKYQARDGMTIYGYLSYPVNSESKQVPLVVLVHGGPYARDENAFDPWVQFLTNRGYLVFQPNFRGSTGYGDAYWKSGYKQWGLAMEDDIMDGVKILTDANIADKARICIMGASYGGYAALMGVAKHSDIFCCAISIAGVSDLNKLLIEERFKGSKNYYNHVLIGDDVSERKASSPIIYAKNINSPVLLAHGTDDTTVYYSHSSNMYSALKGAKKDVTFLKLKDETHYLEDLKNRVELFETIDKFLDKNMGNSSTRK